MGSASRSFYLPTLDGLRFVAFFLVFVHHLPRAGNPVLGFIHDQGWVGVHIFLFLSAYLLTVILATEHELTRTISIKRFLIRRLLRIWPLYFVFWGLMAAGHIYRWGLRHEDIPHLLGLAFFADNWVTGSLGYNAIPHTAHLWTISLEEQFYLLLPWLLARWVAAQNPRTLTTGLASVWLIFVAARVVAVAVCAPPLWIWTSLFSADSLVLGTWLGARRTSVKRPWAQAACVAVGLALLASPAWFAPLETCGAHQVVEYTVIGLGAALLAIASIDSSTIGVVLGNRVIRYLGKISYGLYVFHILAIGVAESLSRRIAGKSAPWILVASIAFSLTVAISIVSYTLLERPFLRLKQRFETVRTRAA